MYFIYLFGIIISSIITTTTDNTNCWVKKPNKIIFFIEIRHNFFY